MPLPQVVAEALEHHRDRQTKERPDAARHRWVETPDVFASSVGTPLEPRTLALTSHALLTRHGQRKARLQDALDLLQARPDTTPED